MRKEQGLLFGNAAGLSLGDTYKMLESCANLRIPPFLQVYRDHDIYIRHNGLNRAVPEIGVRRIGRRHAVLIPCEFEFTRL